MRDLGKLCVAEKLALTSAHAWAPLVTVAGFGELTAATVLATKRNGSMARSPYGQFLWNSSGPPNVRNGSKADSQAAMCSAMPHEIPEEALSETFLASSGPGGQNVNKVATACQLRCDVFRSEDDTSDLQPRGLTPYAV